VKKFKKTCAGFIAAFLLSGSASAGLPVVEAVNLTSLGGNTWRVDVTVSHADSGWDHYANGWRVIDSEGKELGFRELLHPHETEQPFTRGLTLEIAESVLAIRVQAIDLLHGDGEASEEVLIPR